MIQQFESKLASVLSLTSVSSERATVRPATSLSITSWRVGTCVPVAVLACSKPRNAGRRRHQRSCPSGQHLHRGCRRQFKTQVFPRNPTTFTNNQTSQTLLQTRCLPLFSSLKKSGQGVVMRQKKKAGKQKLQSGRFGRCCDGRMNGECFWRGCWSDIILIRVR